MKKPWIFLSILCLTSGCEALQRLNEVGQNPPLTQVEIPNEDPHYKPVTWPKEKSSGEKPNANSLWQADAMNFFKDPRSRKVGDIIKVIVSIEDKAQLDNKTETTRTNSGELDAPKLFGMENLMTAFLPGKPDKTTLVSTGSSNADKGDGKIDRKEKIETQMAAMVTQVLPNGNLVIEGSQEVRVNSELREVSVQGIISPNDITADNTITADQVAQARISYGGRGYIAGIQRPRVGTQVIDALSPF